GEREGRVTKAAPARTAAPASDASTHCLRMSRLLGTSCGWLPKLTEWLWTPLRRFGTAVCLERDAILTGTGNHVQPPWRVASHVRSGVAAGPCPHHSRVLVFRRRNVRAGATNGFRRHLASGRPSRRGGGASLFPHGRQRLSSSGRPVDDAA